jgi:aminoglycoside phosphotransferase (APT) family kinase protein
VPGRSASTTVVRLGDVVAKAHAPDTDAAALAVRLRVAAHPALAGVLLPPLPPAEPARLHDGRLATRWPLGRPVDPAGASGDVPWEAAGTLLARLHAVEPARLGAGLAGALPPSGGPDRVARALDRLRAGAPPSPDRAAVERVLATARSGAGRTALCHGDFHLGQLVRAAPGGEWLLIDVDDLGTGDPAWDLARPAAWYAAGLLPEGDWERFVSAYLAAAGRPGEDPWPWLDGPARAMTGHLAARALLAGDGEERPGERAFVDACRRIAALDGPSA